MLAVGVGTFLLGIGVFFATTRGSGESDGLRAVMPGMIAFLLALMSVGLGVLMDARRMLVYAGVLATGGLVTAWVDANPGWPLLPAGALVAATGLGDADAVRTRQSRRGAGMTVERTDQGDEPSRWRSID